VSRARYSRLTSHLPLSCTLPVLPVVQLNLACSSCYPSHKSLPCRRAQGRHPGDLGILTSTATQVIVPVGARRSLAPSHKSRLYNLLVLTYHTAVDIWNLYRLTWTQCHLDHTFALAFRAARPVSQIARLVNAYKSWMRTVHSDSTCVTGRDLVMIPYPTRKYCFGTLSPASLPGDYLLEFSYWE
jgi:hypothetical protein